MQPSGSRYIKYFWAGALLSLVLFLVMGNLPILDYSKRESLAYMKEPTWGNLAALHEKQNEELRTRLLYASPLGALAVIFVIPYVVYRRTKSRGPG